MAKEGQRSKADVLTELKSTCAQIKELILTQCPQGLLGYLWSRIFLSVFSRTESGADALAPVADAENTIVFAMEYVHAVTAADASFPSEFQNADEDVANSLLVLCEKAISLSFEYGFKATAKLGAGDREKLEFQILTTWILIRGRRYPVLEEEFFTYVLTPHEEALQDIYGVSAAGVAKAIQAAANIQREGIHKAGESLRELMEETAAAKTDDLQGFLDGLGEHESAEFTAKTRSAIEDLFMGGVFNLSKHTDLPSAFLADLSFTPGENDSFFAEGDFAGTPFRTLPARIKPLIQYGDDFYCCEPNLFRDSAYRSIQRAIIRRSPEYKEKWNLRQKALSESAFSDVMQACLKQARIFTDVYYPLQDGNWAEADNIIILDDVLIALECKARVEALSPPSENLDSHVSSIDRLLVEAYGQNKRTLEYLNSTNDPAIFHRSYGQYQEIEHINLRKFRRVFPLCLTLECYTPFSSALKELDGVEPILGVHHPIAFGLDDLMAMRHLFRNTGEFMHYLEVRQNLAAIPEVLLFDEMDHVGAYISNNRIDLRVKEDFLEKQKMNLVYLDRFDQDVLGPYFQSPDWPDALPPSQNFPAVVEEILRALEWTMANGWLAGDSALRDLGSEGRDQVEELFKRVTPNIVAKEWTHFAMAGDDTLVFVICRNDGTDRSHLAAAQAQAYAVAVGAPVRLFQLSVTPSRQVARAVSSLVRMPNLIQANYAPILSEAERLKSKMPDSRRPG
jgi:hypothetical protein